MRRTTASTVSSLLLLLVLTGCGGSTDDTAEDASAEGTSSAPTDSTEPSSEPSSEPEGKVDFRLVEMLTATAAGGTVSTAPTYLNDRSALKEFTQQFRTGELPGELKSAAVRPAGRMQTEDTELAVAVVSIGCDVPPGVTVIESGDALEIVPLDVPDPLPECLAAVTSAALVEVPAQ